MAYPIVLAVHNVVRWVVLILGILALYRSFSGLLGNKEWSDTDRKVGVFFASAIDTQLLVGLILYFLLSPITRGALGDFGAAMGVAGVRFFAVEHTFFMLLAVVFAHLGTMLPKRAAGSKAKFQRAAIWLGLAVVVVLLGMPWMRPLFPGL